MPRTRKPLAVSQSEARRIWMRAQRLDERDPFGSGPEATLRAIEHLGYVQIDTIHVIERSHHHILYSRIPAYERSHLHQAQSVDKSLFEYWTHALAYVPTADFRFFMREMRKQRDDPMRWFGNVSVKDVRKALARLRREGPLTIRDIDDDVLIEKHHPWASRKPTKRALQLAFHQGLVAISRREGMLKTYDLIDRHFGWEKRPRPATEGQIVEYMLDRAIRAQGIVSLDSICHLAAPRKPAVKALIEKRVRRKALVPVAVEGAGKQEHWASPEALDVESAGDSDLVHILSPFDPLIIQRKRLKLFFGYEHLFEAYVKKEKRKLGYFALPVLVGDQIVAAVDLKTDREKGELRVQQWTWVGIGRAREHKRLVEDELGRFERFQLTGA